MKITKRELGRIIREEIMHLTEAPRKQASPAPRAKRKPADASRPIVHPGRQDDDGTSGKSSMLGTPNAVRRQIVAAASNGSLRDKTIAKRLRAALEKAFSSANPTQLNVIMNVANNACAFKNEIEQTQSDDFSYKQDDDELGELEELESDLDDQIEKLHGLFDKLMGRGDFAPKSRVKPSMKSRQKYVSPAPGELDAVRKKAGQDWSW